MAVPDLSDRTLAQLVSLEGRAAVVTGGAKGIGAAIAARLAEAGADVMIGDLDPAGAALTADDLASRYGRKVLSCVCDVSDGDSVAALAARADAELDGIDVWVNNAGIYPSVPVLDMTDADWDRVLDVNLRGAFIGAREAARRMVARGAGGVIVNIASTAGFKAAGPGVAHYVASKHGMRGLTKALAVELGPHRIRVLDVAPTLIETPGIETLREVAGETALGELLDAMAAREPLGRVGVPDDIARVVLFCASDLAMFMTGSTILVDAGDVAL